MVLCDFCFCCFFFFFLMIRRPPRSTLFPTRRSSDLFLAFALWKSLVMRQSRAGLGNSRSEEHTSELQSHSDLVCRLLLEKKQKTQPSSTHRNNKINHNRLTIQPNNI